MRRILLGGMLMSVVSTVTAQDSTSSVPFTPAVPAASSFSSYGGYWGDSGGGTVEGSAMRGMASVISAKGDYNLATSAAAVNLTQAQKQDIQNRQQATQAYFNMQETNRVGRDAKRSPRLSHEQLVRIAADAAPRQVSSNEVNPVTGQVNWPELLRRDQFAEEREALEKLSLKHAHYGALGGDDLDNAGHLIEGMSAKLRSILTMVPAQRYMDAKNFLKSLMFAVSKTTLS